MTLRSDGAETTALQMCAIAFELVMHIDSAVGRERHLKVQVVIGGEVYEVEVEDTEDGSRQPIVEGIQSVVLPGPGSAAQVDADGRIYRSPVAGLVVTVNVEAGQVVQSNDVLLVLEAMKMETRMVAAIAGKVKSIHVAKGEAVKINQVLLELE
jgi:biotin carboxyl carrier protein